MNRLQAAIICIAATLTWSPLLATPPGGWIDFEIEAIDCYQFHSSDSCDEATDIVGGNNIALTHDSHDRLVFRLNKAQPIDSPVSIIEYSKPDASRPWVKATFWDKVMGELVEKTLTLRLIRFEGEPDEDLCNAWLDGRFGTRMSESDRNDRCSRDTLFHWKVATVISNKGPPGDGEGTGSGVGNEN